MTDFINDFRKKESLVVIDPVLGDNGNYMRILMKIWYGEMRRFIGNADVITPNLTELFYLLDRPYRERNTEEELKNYLLELSQYGPQIIIVTSVPVKDDPHKTSVYAYNRQGKRYWKVTCRYLPAHYPGTGRYFYQCSYRSVDARR